MSTLESTSTSTLETAAREYIARRDRHAHPVGEFDSAKRFTLDSSEHCACCAGIREPSRAFPFSEMVHARTLKHVANLFNVDESELRRAVKGIN